MIESKIVDEHVEAYIRGLVPEETGLLKELVDYAEAFHVPIVQPEVAQYLKVLFQMKKPKTVLEIGTAIGYSGSLMALAMREGTIETIELNEDMYQKANETFSALKTFAPNVEVIQHLGEAGEVLKNLNGTYDLIFIDAAKGHYQAFFDLCLPMLSEGGLIVSDNVLYKGMIATDLYRVRRKITIIKRMRAYLKYITSHPALETSILSIGDGVALTLKKEASHETR